MYAAKRSEEAERVARINGAGDDTRWERIDVVFALGKYVGCGGTDGAPWGHEQRQGAVSDWPLVRRGKVAGWLRRRRKESVRMLGNRGFRTHNIVAALLILTL